MKDRDVRKELLGLLAFRHNTEEDTRIVEELAVCNQESIVDVAVINGEFSGFEIKSDSDTLQRLSRQSENYNRVFERITVVAATRHISDVQMVVPEWWGIIEACSRSTSVELVELRAPQRNSMLCKNSLLSMLWRSEIVDLGMSAKLTKSDLRLPLRKLLPVIAEQFSDIEICDAVRNAIKARKNWRVGSSQMKCGDSRLQPPNENARLSD